MCTIYFAINLERLLYGLGFATAMMCLNGIQDEITTFQIAASLSKRYCNSQQILGSVHCREVSIAPLFQHF